MNDKYRFWFSYWLYLFLPWISWRWFSSSTSKVITEVVFMIMERFRKKASWFSVAFRKSVKSFEAERWRRGWWRSYVCRQWRHRHCFKISAQVLRIGHDLKHRMGQIIRAKDIGNSNFEFLLFHQLLTLFVYVFQNWVLRQCVNERVHSYHNKSQNTPKSAKNSI